MSKRHHWTICEIYRGATNYFDYVRVCTICGAESIESSYPDQFSWGPWTLNGHRQPYCVEVKHE